MVRRLGCFRVLASEGYPGAYEKGKVILGIEEAEELPGVTVFHAGTRRNYDGELLTNGGRVLNVVAKGDSFEEARERAYEPAISSTSKARCSVTISARKLCRAAAPGISSRCLEVQRMG